MANRADKRTLFQRFFQYLFLTLFIALIAAASYPSKDPFPLDIFLRLDPLIAIGTSIATWEIIDKAFISLSIIIVSLLLGRIFCGYVCPLGTSIDLGEKLLKTKSPKKQKDRLAYAKEFNKFQPLKYYLLIITLSSAAFGFSLFYFFDPISLVTRTAGTVFYPLVVLISNAFLDLIRPLAAQIGFIEISHLHYIQPVFGSNLLIFLLFLTIILLSVYQSRFWCRYLCPLGALLGICANKTIIKRAVSQDCNDCDQCRLHCPMNAIPENPKETIQSECIRCETCVSVCPQNAVRFNFISSRGEIVQTSPLGLTRRAVLSSMAAGFTFSFLGGSHIARAGAKLIRPPGAIPENEFLSRCVRCGECMKSCTTNTLQPALFDSGIEGFWTPMHRMRHAGCEQQCNLCGQVCPTQAIRSLPLMERKFARVGTAVITKDKCIAWEQNKLCIICDEQCPYNAIVFKTIDGHKRPFINEAKCNGCGICEQKCPVAGEAAIVVWPMGEIRLKKGSYIKEAQKLQLNFMHEKDLLEDSLNEHTQSETSPVKPKLPPGFILE